MRKAVYRLCPIRGSIMTNPSTDSVPALETVRDADLWDSLKQAIASSSGFQSWRAEQSEIAKDTSVEKLVRLYLRETLETLAY